MKIKFFTLFFIVLASFGAANAAHADLADLSTWSDGEIISIDHTNVDATLTDFPLLVRIVENSDLSDSMSNALDNGYDIRFTADDGTALLSYERESWSGGDGNPVVANFWVKVPSISNTDDTHIHMYWGKAGISDGQDSTNVWDSNYAAVYHDPSNLTDSTSNGNDCTNNNGVAANPSGAIGGAASFDGDLGTYLDCGNGESLTFDTGFTTEMWVKPTTSTGGWYTMLGKDGYGNDTEAGKGWLNVLFGGGQPQRFFYLSLFDGGDIYTNSTGSLPADTWTHLVSANDNGTVTLYNDGVANNDVSNNHPITNAAVNLFMGARHSGDSGWDYYSGLLDEVRISSVPRSEAWVKFEYYNQSLEDNGLIFGSIFSFTTGSGTVDDPWQVTTCQELQAIGSSADYLDDYYILVPAGDSDTLDCSETLTWNEDPDNLGTYFGFIPIGSEATPFTGVFDGDENTIDGLYIDRSGTDYVGLFGVVQTGADEDTGMIKYVTLTNVYVSGFYRVGGLVGKMFGGTEVISGNVEGEIHGINYVGGLVGVSLGSITTSEANVSVYGGNYVGGLVGALSGTEGDYNQGLILASHSSGEVHGGDQETGGLVGVTTAYGVVDYSSSEATVTGNWTVGGLVGTAQGEVSNSSAGGNVIANNYGAGGLVGYLNGGVVYASFATGDVSAGSDGFDLDNISSYAGGLVGMADDGGLPGSGQGDISESYATGDVTGTSIRVGGLAGGTNSTIEDCYARGNVTGENRVGGLVGGLSGEITNAYSTGTVTVTGEEATYFGGLVGLNIGTASGSYWDTETSGESTSNGGTGKLTSEMKKQATFVGWNFEDIWQSNFNNYPTLRFYSPSEPVNVGPTAEKFQADIEDGFISITGGNPLATTAVIFEEDYTIIIGDENNPEAKVVLPAGTVMTKTGGGTLNFTEMDFEDITTALQGATAGNIAGAVSLGIPGLKLSFSPAITITINIGSEYNDEILDVYFQNEGESLWNDGITCTVVDGLCVFETDHATKYSAGDKPDGTIEEEAQEAHIDSWKATKYEKPDTSCVQRIKINIKGKYFDKDAEVRIGNKEASDVNRKSSKELTAKFCMEKLLNVQTDLKRTISVTNPDTDRTKAKKKIDLSEYLETTNVNSSIIGSENVKNIQSVLVKLGYLDAEYITGIYGPITTEAVKKFQGDNGIEQTGTVGPLTKAKLAEKLQ